MDIVRRFDTPVPPAGYQPPVNRPFRRAARLLFQLFPDAVVDSFARTVLLLI
jgi:hypothetical protein